MKFPKYIKTADGQIGTYAHLTFGNRPVYRFGDGEYKFRQATETELAHGSDRLSDLAEQKREPMQWKQLSSAVWEAVGKYGKFRVERSGNKFWAVYASDDTQFNLPPCKTLAKAKLLCERNLYWEDAA